jgi:hypothetical protein
MDHMNLTEFIGKAVKRGIASVQRDDRMEHYKKEAAIKGFVKCLRLGTIEQFEAELERCHEEQDRLRKASERQKSGIDLYWAQRYFTLQVEHVYGLLCFAARHNNWPNNERYPDHLALSARLGMEYYTITSGE